jgi:hypothetical protein
MADLRMVLEDGDTIEQVVELASKAAIATKKILSFHFRGLQVVVGPSHNADTVVRDYLKRASTYKEGD